jgi:hypothetical protein
MILSIVRFLPMTFIFGLIVYFIVVKRRAAAALRSLLAERFVERLCPVEKVLHPSGWFVYCKAAYDDTQGSGFVLVFGDWDRGISAGTGGPHHLYSKVSGLFRSGSEVAWLERVRSQKNVVIAKVVEDGAIVFWYERPSHNNILAHLKAVSSGGPAETT